LGAVESLMRKKKDARLKGGWRKMESSQVWRGGVQEVAMLVRRRSVRGGREGRGFDGRRNERRLIGVFGARMRNVGGWGE